MANKSSEIDSALKKVSDMDISTAMRVLIKKGIKPENMADRTGAFLHNLVEDIDKENLDNDHKMLYHLVISYYIFSGAIHFYDEWIKIAAAEHNLKPDKYTKIMFDWK